MGLVLSISLGLMMTRKSCMQQRGIRIEQIVRSDMESLIKRKKSFDSPQAHF